MPVRRYIASLTDGGDFAGTQKSTRLSLFTGREWGWLAYWKELSHDSVLLTDLRTRRDALFNSDAFPNVMALQAQWATVERVQAEFVNRVTNESLEKLRPFRTTQISLAHLTQHLLNHSTYHRGQSH